MIEGHGMAEFISQLSDEEQAGFMHMLLSFKKQIQMNISAGATSEDLVRLGHEFIDVNIDKLKQDDSVILTCRKGCAHCCHLHVDITEHEAEILWQLITKEQVEKLRLQQGYHLNNWREQSQEQRRCVFLDENNCCSIYEYRPGSCRKYHVVSPVENCDMEFEEKVVRQAVALPAEVYVMAEAMTMRIGSMPDMILEKLKL